MGSEAIRQRAVFKLAKQLEQVAVHSQLDPDSLRVYLKGLREQFVREGGSEVLMFGTRNNASSSELEE
jgi:hypothetical protein